MSIPVCERSIGKTTLNEEVCMYQQRTVFRGRKLLSLWLKRILFNSVLLMCVPTAIFAQEEIDRRLPIWWFGGAIGGNLNFYGGTTQMLNAGLTTPSAFHKGFGAGFYLAGLVEYRPNPTWGGMLQVGYDDRRGAFDDVPCPCPPAMSSLWTTISYISIEPSIRFAPFKDGFYVFAGPRIAFNWAPNFTASSTADEKEFIYTQGGVAGTKGELSNMNGTVFSGQIGAGYDVALVSQNGKNQVNLSPFISYQPYFGQEPRSVESWAVSTLRLGLAIKFGSGSMIPPGEYVPPVVEREVEFSVQAPKAVPVKRRVKETFPLRNYVFFEEGSAEIPYRYELLTKEQAANFKEEQLQEVQPKIMVGRSGRQMGVYYNILNIIGDRMKRNPGTTISLSGASKQGAEHGKARAETIKKYLVDVFGIEGSRITTEGREKPRLPSEVPGATKELSLLRAGDRRVDIESTSPEMMMQVGRVPMLKPVQIVAVVEDPLDGHVLFNVIGAKEALSSWSLEITDAQGNIQRFGPSTRERETIPGNAILGVRAQGDYKVVMLGQTKSGKFVRKESTVHLVRREDPLKEAVRFSILFDFDQSKSIASYENFLSDVVTPLIPDNGIVIIHGYSDIIGDDVYNDNLSEERVADARAIIERAASSKGKRGITYATFGFGEDVQYAPFDNFFPEGRFYNRTVIIDIVPD